MSVAERSPLVSRALRFSNGVLGSSGGGTTSAWLARVARPFEEPSRATTLWYALYTALAFVFFLVVTFPHESVLRGLLARAAGGPVAIDVNGVRLGFPLAYRIDELRVTPRSGDAGVPMLVAQSVRVAPSLLGLVRGHGYPVAVSGNVYGGTVDGSADLRPATFAVDAKVSGVDVARYTGLRLFMDGTLAGRVDGGLTVHGDTTKPATTTGRVDLRIAGVALEGGKVRGIGIPDLHFDEVKLGGDIRRGRLELAEVRADGREIIASGDGNIVMQHPLAASVLNVTLRVRPAPEAPDNLRLALNLLPGTPSPDGEKTLRFFGTLAQPRVQ